MHHEYLLLGTHSMHATIITHTNQQTPAIGIGEGRDRPCEFRRIANLIFKVLLLMLALSYVLS